MSKIKKKKKTKFSLIEKFRRSKFKQKLSEFITWIENTIQLDRKRAKLLIFMITLIFIFFIDLIWLVFPSFIKEKEAPIEYTKEEIPALIVENKLAIEENPKDFQAHFELGKIYFFIKESEKAKIEFFQAVEYAPKGNYKAHFELANMYIKYYKKPEMAVKIMNDIDDNLLSNDLLLKKTDYLFDIYKLFFSQNKFSSAYTVLQEAYNNYGRLNQTEKLAETKKEMSLLLLDMADVAYYDEKNITKAMVYVENSQKLEENAGAYSKLGYLFFEDPKISADYFEKAYTYDPNSVNEEVFVPTLVSAIDICTQENRMADKSYYKGVLGRVRQEHFTSKIHTKLIANNLKGFYEKVEGKDEYLPVAYLDIYNGFDRKSIDYVKIRAVFVNANDQIVGHHDLIAINSDKPLLPQKSRINIRLESNRIITGQQKKDNIYKVIIYFSKTRPDKWSYATDKIIY